jgi:hypothetical protein
MVTAWFTGGDIPSELLLETPYETHVDDTPMNESDACLATLSLLGVCLRHLLSNEALSRESPRTLAYAPKVTLR